MVDLHWNRSVAAVIDSAKAVRGTAFFIGDDIAMTCQHVLEAAADGPVFLRRCGSDEDERVLEADADSGLDLALVRVALKPNTARLTVATEAPEIGHAVVSHGFPRDHPIAQFPNGIPLDGAQITGPTILNWQGRSVDQLTLFGSGFQAGFSGAPAVDESSGQVVGVLTKLESNERAYAIPAEVARLRWPDLPSGGAAQSTRFADVTKIVDAVASAGWDAFEPASLHCLVVASEGDPNEELSAVLSEALARPDASDIWNAFRDAVNGRHLLGDIRDLAPAYTTEKVQQASFSVPDAFASFDSLASATRLLVEADLVLFDVTGFEPGVMLLVGIRAATRRGVTITSHGAGWQEGQPLERPFNVSDLSLSSHSLSSDSQVGDDPRVIRLAARIRLGFSQYAQHPNYLDLPVYDALRRLGSQETAWATIPLDDEVLVLCSYHARYFDTWRDLRRHVGKALYDLGTPTTVGRLLDTATPQLVSQTLYERIRRCAACIADWTFTSPSTFLELGVRLVASPWGAVQIARRNSLESPTRPDGEAVPTVAKQMKGMQELFRPLLYDDAPDPSIGTQIAKQLVSIREQVQGRSVHPVRQAATEALSRIDEQLPDPDQMLREEADALNNLGTRTNVPQALFYEAKDIKLDQERAALERRVAAWLYLEHRVGARELPDGDDRKVQWSDLGLAVVSELYARGEDADLVLAADIEELLL